MRRLQLLLFFALFFCAVGANAQRVIGYYAGWEQAYATLEYDKLTDINYAFAEPQTNNTVGFPDAYNLQLFQTFVNYAKNQQTQNPNIRVNISIGGASETLSSRFNNIGSNASSAATFAASCVDLCLQYDLDGIDIDWEPVVASHATSFTTLMRELREEIDARAPQLQLSAAVFPENFAGTWFGQGGQIPNAGVTSGSFQYVDYFSIMCYDYGAPDFASHAPEAQVMDAINYWTGTKGLEVSKLVLGLPFYGRSSYWAYSRDDQIPYEDLIAQNNSATVAGSDAIGNWRYNGQATIKSKTQTALDQGLKGVMIWEISQDVTGQYSLLASIDEAIDEIGCQGPNLGESVIICGQSSVTLSAGLDEATTTFEWKLNNQTISNSDVADYVATQGGTYEVTATKDADGCTRTGIIQVIDEFDAPDLGSGIPLCGGETVEVDGSVGIDGLTYSWSNGSSTVSSTNILSFNSPATYTVTITDPQGHCATQTASVEASPSALSVEGDEVCAGTEANLVINSQGGPYSWFAQENGGTFIHVGNDYQVSPSSTTTYYVQNTGGSQKEIIGLTERGGGTNFGAYVEYQDVFVMEISVNQALTIDTVTIFPDWSENTTSFDIELVSGMTKSGGQIDGSSGTVIDTKTLSYTADGGADVAIIFPLGMEIETPGTYHLRIVNPDGVSPRIFYGQISDKPFGDPEYEAFPYPFEFDNIMSIVTSYGWGGWEDVRTYGGIYDWRISTGATCPRVPVTATVNQCEDPEVSIVSSPNSDLFIGDQVTITATGTDGDGTVDGMQLYINDVQIAEGLNAQGNGVYTYELDLSIAQEYEVCAIAVDNDGLESAEACVNLSVGAVGFEENFTENGFTIFPNPTAQNFQIQHELNEEFLLNVIDSRGITVSSTTYSANAQVKLGDNLEKGIYTIQLVSEGQIYTSQLIKQ